ncbi:6060_t:CDS:2, partial [Gigaspora margarita]
ENDENPYYDDTIVKYMHCPSTPEFENLTYPQYFEQYSITPSRPLTLRTIHRDQLNNYIIKHRLLNSLANQLPTNLHEIIHSQLNNLKILPYIFPLTAILELPPDQYKALSTISIYMGKAN